MCIRATKEYLLKHKRGLGLVLCLALAGGFSTYKLTESPKTWFDEGIFVQVARNLLKQHSYVLRISPTETIPAGIISTVGFPVIAPVSLSFLLFGVGLLQARVMMVAYILLTVVALYVFAASVWGVRTAVWSTLLVTTHAPLYGNGKNVLGEVPGLFFFFLFLNFVSRLEQRHGSATRLWIGAGLSAGLFAVTKPNFVLLLPILGVACLLQRQRIMQEWKAFLCGITALAFPLAIYFITQFGFATPITTIFLGYANLSGLQRLTGLTLPALIVKNALLFVRQMTPAYLLVTCAVWLAHFAIRIRHKLSVPWHEWIALAFSLSTIAYFLKMPGFFRYLFVAQVITFPYFVASSFQFASIVHSVRRLGHAVVGLFTIMVSFQLYALLFNSFVAGYYHSTRSQELEAYFRQLDPSTRIFVYHAPEVVTFIPRDTYFQYFELIYFADSVGKDQLASMDRGASDRVILPSDLEQDAHPHLGAYKKAMTMDAGRYSIYERK